jgi:hypothetical protein
MKEFIKYKLTKKKAIEITIELWKWMEQNPDKNKQDWPGWRVYDYADCGCSCCEYTKRKTRNVTIDKNCEEFCPLIMLWPYKRDISSDGITIRMSCEQDQSIYAKWSQSHFKKNKVKYARELWQSAERILEKL